MITYKEVLGLVKRADALNDIYRGSDDWMLRNGYIQAPQQNQQTVPYGYTAQQMQADLNDPSVSEEKKEKIRQLQDSNREYNSLPNQLSRGWYNTLQGARNFFGGTATSSGVSDILRNAAYGVVGGLKGAYNKTQLTPVQQQQATQSQPNQVQGTQGVQPAQTKPTAAGKAPRTGTVRPLSPALAQAKAKHIQGLGGLRKSPQNPVTTNANPTPAGQSVRTAATSSATPQRPEATQIQTPIKQKPKQYKNYYVQNGQAIRREGAMTNVPETTRTMVGNVQELGAPKNRIKMTQQQAETFNKHPGMVATTTRSGGKIWTTPQDKAMAQRNMQKPKASGGNPYATTNSPYAVIPTGPSPRAQQIDRRNQQAMKAYRRGSRRTYVPSIASSGRRTSRYV